MLLFERGDHIARLRPAIDECLAGRGRVLTIQGVAASGRTTLLHRVISDAKRAGMQVIQATCPPWETQLAGSALSQLMLSIPAAAERAERAEPTYQDFCREMLGLAVRVPLLIAVDDIDHADDDSMRHLLYLARRLRAARVLLAVTSQRDDDRSCSPFITELVSGPEVCQLAVAPLSAVGTAQLLNARLGHQAASRGLAAQMHHISGGNLALLESLIDDYLRENAPGGDFIAEQGYGATLVGMLGRWGPAALRIAQAMAVLGELSTAERVAQLTALDKDIGAGTVERVMTIWTQAGISREGRFPHPVGGAAVLGTLMTAERAELHKTCAVPELVQ
jgi:hypothetical protein